MAKLIIKDFTANSSWKAPAGCTQVILYGCGGGSGGYGGSAASNGGAGGFASKHGYTIVTVVPNTTYTITIGAGGAGSASGSSGTPSSGTDTSFGALATFMGAVASNKSYSTTFSIGFNYYPFSIYNLYQSTSTYDPNTWSIVVNNTGVGSGMYGASQEYVACPTLAGKYAANGAYAAVPTYCGASGAGESGTHLIGGAGIGNVLSGSSSNGNNAPDNSGAGGSGGVGNTGTGGTGGSGRLSVLWVE
jgi:hypothetical protein